MNSGQIGVSSYLTAAREAEIESIGAHTVPIRLMDEIDLLYRKFVTGEVLASVNPVALLLAQSSHADFLAAASTALRGQFAPTFMIIRGCVESALYSYIAGQSDDDAAIWIHREADPKAARRQFTATRAISLLRPVDVNLATMMEDTYRLSIDFGGHPNFRSLSDSLGFGDVESDGREYWSLNLTYIHSYDALATVRAILATIENACVAIAVICNVVADGHPEKVTSQQHAWDIFRRAGEWAETGGLPGK